MTTPEDPPKQDPDGKPDWGDALPPRLPEPYRPPSKPSSGWTFLRLVGFFLSLISMVGFGVCSLCGLLFTGSGFEVLGLVLIGAVIAILAALCLKALWQRVYPP